MTIEGQWLLFNQIAPIGLHQQVNFGEAFFFIGSFWIFLEERHEYFFSVWKTLAGFSCRF